MAYRVLLGPRARSDIGSTVTWLARASVVAAAKWRNDLFSIMEKLEAEPIRHPLAEEAADLGVDLRVVLFGRRRGVYCILFTVEGETVNVLRAHHAARDRLTLDDI